MGFTRSASALAALATLCLAGTARGEDVEGKASAYLAGLSYRGHEERTGGLEGQARLDLEAPLRWNAHFAYTGLAIGHQGETPLSSEGYHDLLLGGWVAPDAEEPFWLRLEAHVVLGELRGAAAFAGAGARLGPFTFELGGGGAWLDSLDRTLGATASARVAYRVHEKLELAALGLATYTAPGSDLDLDARWRFSAGGELVLGPFSIVKLELRALGGSRSLALDGQGVVFESLLDPVRISTQALLRFELDPRASVYVGAGWRRVASLELGGRYDLFSGFAGFELGF